MAGIHQSFLFNPITFSISSGTKAPVFGPSGGLYPPPSWTGVFDGDVDDDVFLINLPFSWTISNVDYTYILVCSNNYLTFYPSSITLTPSVTDPPVDKILFGGGDFSVQRLSYLISPNNFYLRIRFEGTTSTAGTPGSPNIVWETTFFNPVNFRGQSVVEILTGTTANSGLDFGVASSTAFYANDPSGVQANTSYVFVGNSSGTSFNINIGSFVSGIPDGYGYEP